MNTYRKLVELYAENIYNTWHDQEGWVEWMPLGNSNKQVEARQKAAMALEQLGVTEEDCVIRVATNGHVDLFDETDDANPALMAVFEDVSSEVTLSAIIEMIVGRYVLADVGEENEGRDLRFICNWGAYRQGTRALGETIPMTVPRDVPDMLDKMVENINTVLKSGLRELTYGVGETHVIFTLGTIGVEGEGEEGNEEGEDEPLPSGDSL